MKIQFDPSQQFQHNGVAAVTDIFDGQPLEKLDYSVIFQTFDTELFSRQARSELGVGNRLTLDDEALHKNIRKIQERNETELPDAATKLESWPILGHAQESLQSGLPA